MSGDCLDMGQLADAYDGKRRMVPADLERLLGLIQRHGHITGRALEIGCGTGFLLVPLAERLHDVHFSGIELAEPMLAHATRKVREHSLANCFLARGDGLSLPFANGTFDFILMSQVLHFFPDRAKAAAEVRRVGTANARLAVITTSHAQLRAQVDLGLFPGMMKREAARVPTTAAIRHNTPQPMANGRIHFRFMPPPFSQFQAQADFVVHHLAAAAEA